MCIPFGRVFLNIVYREACIRTSRACFLSLGSFPSFKYWITSLAHSGYFEDSTTCTGITFTGCAIEGWWRVYTCSFEASIYSSIPDPSRASESAQALSSRGTLVTSTLSKVISNSFTLDKYFFIFSPRASYSSNVSGYHQSLLTSRTLTPNSRATSKLTMTCSYPASLVATKASFIANSICSPSGLMSTTPALAHFLVEYPSMQAT